MPLTIVRLAFVIKITEIITHHQEGISKDMQMIGNISDDGNANDGNQPNLQIQWAFSYNKRAWINKILSIPNVLNVYVVNFIHIDFEVCYCILYLQDVGLLRVLYWQGWHCAV